MTTDGPEHQPPSSPRDWATPGGGEPAVPPPPGPPQVTTEPGGPPPTPHQRRRRARRRVVLTVVAAVLVVGVPIALFALGTFNGLTLGEQDEDAVAGPGDADDGDDPAQPDPDGDPDGERDAGPSEDGPEVDGLDPDEVPEPDAPIGERPGVSPSLDAPDPDGLDGIDAAFARLLIDIDDSERAMIGFQERVAEAFGDLGSSPDLIPALQDIASEQREELLEVRDRLEPAVDESDVEAVREIYLLHLDSWADYMEAVAEDPSVLAGEGVAGGYTVVINQTADAFRRTLDARMPLDADAEVQDFAEGILDRGFRGFGEAQV